MKEYRRKRGFSQAKLAETADTSTHYIAMIELKRKFPSPEMLERIAAALEIDTPELFSMPPSAAGALRRLHEEVLWDMEKTLDEAVNRVVKKSIKKVIFKHIKDLDDIT
jgi:transcriptional regulator with XRE-family HTH domain